MKFQLHFSFFLLPVFTIIVPDYAGHFFLAYMFIFIHELFHILAARILSLRTEKIILSGFGVRAYISNFFAATAKKKFIILLAGPLVNFLLACIFLLLGEKFCAHVNFALAVFNLLPVYPLDGGRIFIALCKIFGISNLTWFIKLNRIIIFVLFVIGCVQFYLFCPNFSLLLISTYLWLANKISFVHFVYEIYFS